MGGFSVDALDDAIISLPLPIALQLLWRAALNTFSVTTVRGFPNASCQRAPFLHGLSYAFRGSVWCGLFIFDSFLFGGTACPNTGSCAEGSEAPAAFPAGGKASPPGELLPSGLSRLGPRLPGAGGGAGPRSHVTAAARGGAQ